MAVGQVPVVTVWQSRRGPFVSVPEIQVKPGESRLSVVEPALTTPTRKSTPAVRMREKNCVAVRPRRSWSSDIEPEVSTVQRKSTAGTRSARNTWQFDPRPRSSWATPVALSRSPARMDESRVGSS